MKNTVTRDAAATLAAVDEVLHRTAAHWTDPEVLEWEAGQIGPFLSGVVHDTESGQPVRQYRALPGELNESYDRTGPMVRLVDDHECPGAPTRCMWEAPGPVFAVGSAETRADDYPPPEDTTYGPLMLGPEPATGPRAMSPTSAAALQRAINRMVARAEWARCGVIPVWVEHGEAQ